jgi:N-acetylglucosaminyldiphosphoundecaprenol N-acetyl-beta-D-mannosaminyltransferase
MVQFLEPETMRTLVVSEEYASNLGMLEAPARPAWMDTVSQRAVNDRLATATTLTPRLSSDDVPAGPVRVTRFMGAPMGVVTEAEAVRAIVDAAETGSGHWTITANLDHIRRYHSDPVQKALIDEADLVVADGMPLIWASHLAGEPLPERVSGSSMVWSICEAASVRGQSVFLLGGDPGVAEQAAQIFRDRYPGVEIVGTACPPVGFESDEQECDRIKRQVTEAAPRIVFVALGFPKQDLLIRILRESLPHASFLGVGISLSYATGDVSRAPGWICGLGLEWAYRLSQEPTRRLVRRYLVDGLPFGVQMMMSAARHRARRRSHGGPWGRDD